MKSQIVVNKAQTSPSIDAAQNQHGRDLVNQLLGQAQAFQAAGNLLQTFGVSKLAIVKENKLYQQLKGMTTPNGLELSGTWAEFCQLLGVSDDKANQDIANLKVFGEEALEQMQRIGIGYRELRQYRRLPADQQQALIEVAKTGDKEGFVELAEEIIAKHAKEKEALKQVIEAKDSRIEENSKRINELEDDAAIRRTRKPDQVRADDEKAALDATNNALSFVTGDMRKHFKALMAHEKEGGHSYREIMAGYVAQIEAELDVLKGEFFLRQLGRGE